MATRKFERLSKKQIERLVKMRDDGFPFNAIADRFGICRSYASTLYHKAKKVKPKTGNQNRCYL